MFGWFERGNMAGKTYISMYNGCLAYANKQQVRGGKQEDIQVENVDIVDKSSDTDTKEENTWQQDGASWMQSTEIVKR